jgi:hypothetical protein
LGGAAVLGAVALIIVVVLHVMSERASVEGLRKWGDVAFLDDYAEELGIVMSRAWATGTEPERFPRQVDGPGPGIETLEVSSAGDDGGTVVVMRLRRERVERGFLS